MSRTEVVTRGPSACCRVPVRSDPPRRLGAVRSEMWIRTKTPQEGADADDHQAEPAPQVPVEAAARWIECCWPVCNQHQGTGQVRHYLRARGAQVLAVWDFLGFNDHLAGGDFAEYSSRRLQLARCRRSPQNAGTWTGTTPL